ncbi:MAG: PspC domain-containing protein [bacterium]|nr:PspC domain-containing protein [bacterium]
MKRLYRSKTNRVCSGVMGGLGDYFEVDPVVLRVLLIFFIVFTGFFPGVIVYILSVFVMPEAYETITSSEKVDSK